MRNLIVSEFTTLDGVMLAPGGKDENRDGGFEHCGWTMPFGHDNIFASFESIMKEVDALLPGPRTCVIHAEAFEPSPEDAHRRGAR